MKFANLVWAAALMFAASPSSAASLCNCCGAKAAENCTTTCASVTSSEAQCVAAVDYAGKSTISAESNPLYTVSFRNIWLGSPRRAELESFRRLLEVARKSAERDRRAGLRASARGETDSAAAEQANQRYNTAIINYFLGIELYRAAARVQ